MIDTILYKFGTNYTSSLFGYLAVAACDLDVKTIATLA